MFNKNNLLLPAIGNLRRYGSGMASNGHPEVYEKQSVGLKVE
jgi:hypothetical protein